jgi:hypothetical protein
VSAWSEGKAHATLDATARRSDALTGFHLLIALTEDREIAELLAKYGTSATEVRERVARNL